MNRFAKFFTAIAAVSSLVAASSACAQWGAGFGRSAASGYQQAPFAGAFGFQRAVGGVFVNGRRLSRAIVYRMAMRGVRVPAGRYWYDRRSGAWGLEGGPARGLLPAGLPLGGRLRANASNGRSGVTINGRRLQVGEAAVLRQLLPRLTPGRYWVDGAGNAGRVGGPALVNLRSLLGSRGGNRGWRYHKGNTYMIGGQGVFGISFKSAGKTYSYIR